MKVPENYYLYHSPDCGTAYRGCAPDCPKAMYERTGIWNPKGTIVIANCAASPVAGIINDDPFAKIMTRLQEDKP